MLNKREIKNINALDSAEPFDVCIIGSGPAGTILGKSLVERGVRTVILESGGSVFRWLFDSRLKRLAAYQVTGDTDYPLTNSRARALGGTSNFWTGRCTRLQPSDFKINPYTHLSNPWPITYEELESYYEQAEKSLRVRGGSFSEYVPPRRNSLPIQSKTDISGLKSLMNKAGVILDDTPTATPTKGIRFFRVQKEILPDFLTSPFGTIVNGVDVTRLIPGSDMQIDKAEITMPDGEKKYARAKIFVLACGGIETPRLLLHSRSEQFPNGIGNTYDRVGRCFNEHPAVNFYANIKHTKSTLNPRNKIGRSHQFYEKFRAEGLGSVLLVVRQALLLPHHNMPLKSDIINNLFAIAKRIIKPTLYIGATIEMRISDSNRVTLSKEMKDPFGNPLAHLVFNYSEDDLKTLDRCRELILNIYERIGAADIQEAEVSWSRHHQSTCMMGDNPKTSVVDANLHVHDTKNLYICGSEVFVTGGAMQPCLTIAALSHRLANHLITRFNKN